MGETKPATANVEAFIDRWTTREGGAERANYALFLAELCDQIGVPRPEPSGAEIVPFDDAQADIARDAFLRFGKGRHPAGLNFGDCAAYALAISEAEPLLFKCADFAATDVEVVRWGGES